MALATTSRVRVSPVRVSWDTQQRLTYNRNAPRQIKKPDSLSLSSTSTSQVKQISRLQVDVDELLKFTVVTPRQEEQKVNLEEPTYLGYERWLPSPPKVEKPRSSHNAASLAYIGDCIYELYARRHFLAPALNIEEYNDRVMAVVRCEAQVVGIVYSKKEFVVLDSIQVQDSNPSLADEDALLQKLLNENFLSGEERDVLRWGKNITSAKTRTTKRAGVAVYNRASSLETLIGYLYLTNTKRLDDMMSTLGFSVGISNQSILEDVNRELQNIKQK